MKPIIQKLSHMLLETPDLDRALAFYVDFLGLRVRDRAELADGRAYVAMVEGLGLTTIPDSGPKGRSFDHIAFRCPDGIGPLVERLKGAGIPYEEPRRSPYGLSVYFRDPDGNRLECHDATGVEAG
jgi:catechol 2,3-dioxygenase-like lactoylglutathione lyase family enzyme